MGVEKFDEDEDFNESNLIHVRLPGRKVNTFKFFFLSEFALKSLIMIFCSLRNALSKRTQPLKIS